jgi:hypothetical protein
MGGKLGAENRIKGPLRWGFPSSFSRVIETRKPISSSQYEAISGTCAELYSAKSAGKDKLFKLSEPLSLSGSELPI